MSDKDYSTLAKEQKTELKERQQEIRENSKFTGHEMFQAYVGITGNNPFTGEPHTNGRQVIGPQIGTRDYPDAHSFSAKLNKNKKELSDNLTATQGIFPTLSEEQQEANQEYKNKRRDIATKNAGIDDIQEFAQNFPASDIDNIIQQRIESEGNLKTYNDQITKLENEYSDLLETLKEQEAERQTIISKRLLKSEFDLITEQESIDSGLNQQEQEWIDIMIDF